MSFSVDTLHYFVTFMFFMITLILIIKLTTVFNSMDVPSGDTNGQEAKDTIQDALIVGWVAVLIIFLLLITAGILGYTGGFEYSFFMDGLSSLTGKTKIFLALRVIIFSILVITSIIVASLCSVAASEILNSNTPSLYTDQYNECLDIAKTMFLHVGLLFIAQGTIYLISYYTKRGKIRNEDGEEGVTLIDSNSKDE